MNDQELISLVKEYIANIEIINRKQAGIDLFHIEDTLNRELGTDLFVIDMHDKINAVINNPRISYMLVGA